MESKSVEISIIIPVYNVEKYIKKCIDSVIAQTFRNIEIILVDDGSTDRSGSICDEYLKLDDRIKVIHKRNGGLSSARNAGIVIAQGKYLGFVDSDDFIAEDMYEVLYQNAEKENADISICGVFHCYEGVRIKKNKKWYKVLEPEEAIKFALQGKQYSVNAVNKLYKRWIFEDICYPEGKCSEDAFVIVDIFSKCKKIVATSDQKYFYIHRKGSISTAISAANCFDCIEAYKKNKEIIYEKYPSLKNLALSNYCWSYFYALDRLLLSNDKSSFIMQEQEIVQFLKSKTGYIILKSKLARNRKIAALVLCFSVELYRKLLLINIETKERLYI